MWGKARYKSYSIKNYKEGSEQKIAFAIKGNHILNTRENAAVGKKCFELII